MSRQDTQNKDVTIILNGRKGVDPFSLRTELESGNVRVSEVKNGTTI